MNRDEALARLRAEVERGNPIIGAGAGTGLSAKCAEAGGVDLIIIYNSGRYRMAGRGSLAGLLPYGDANAIVVDMAAEVLPVVEDTPVLAGVCGTDPFRLMPVSSRIRRNWPSIRPTVGKFCTPSKPIAWSSGRKTRISRKGSVPQTPASTGVRVTTGSTSRAMSTTIALASP